MQDRHFTERFAATSRAAEWLGTIMLSEALALVALATWLQT